MSSICFLDSLAVGSTATVKKIHSSPGASADIFWEIGITEGATIELVRKAPIFSDPLMVRCNGVLIALRKSEALQVEVIQ